MKALRIHVERAVRPVRASGLRKDRMREELLAHLAGVFEEELVRLGDEQAAAQEAIRRFGAAQDVSRQLQAAVPRVEQWLHTRVPGVSLLDRVFGPRAGESLRQLAWRMVVVQTLVVAVLVACTVAVGAMVRGAQLLPRLIGFACGVVGLVFGGQAVLFALLAPELGRAMDALPDTPRSWLGLAACSAITGAVAAGLGLAAALWVNWYSTVSIFRPDQWWLLPLVALAGLLGLAFYTWGWRRELRRFEEWGSLEIEEAG